MPSCFAAIRLHTPDGLKMDSRILRHAMVFSIPPSAQPHAAWSNFRYKPCDDAPAQLQEQSEYEDKRASPFAAETREQVDVRAPVVEYPGHLFVRGAVERAVYAAVRVGEGITVYLDDVFEVGCPEG